VGFGFEADYNAAFAILAQVQDPFRSLSHGIDFLGYVLFLHHRLIRTSTSRRMKCRLNKAFESFLQGKIHATDMDQRLQSYLGLLSHANQHSLSQALKNSFWVRKGNFPI
jgi:hypothetical protein